MPVVAQMTFVEDGRTLGGDSPEEVATTLADLGVAALGANCTLGPQGLLDVLAELARWTSLPLTAQPNAGPPTLIDGQFPVHVGRPGVLRAPRAPLRRARRDAGRRLLRHHAGPHRGGRARSVSRPATGDAHRAWRDAGIRLHAATRARPTRAGADGGQLRCWTGPRAVSWWWRASCRRRSAPTPSGRSTDAALLKAAGCHAVIVGPVDSTRAQVSPASIALLVQQRVPGLEVILTATTWEKSLMVLQADLLGTYAFGIRHVLCRTGTPPLHGDYPNAAGVWEVDSLGLIEVLRGLNEGRDYNGIPVGRPTAFVIGARVNPAASDFAHEVATARRKLASGANFLITPPVYDLDALERLLDAIDPPADVPVLLGLCRSRICGTRSTCSTKCPRWPCRARCSSGCARRARAASGRARDRAGAVPARPASGDGCTAWCCPRLPARPPSWRELLPQRSSPAARC